MDESLNDEVMLLDEVEDELDEVFFFEKDEE